VAHVDLLAAFVAARARGWQALDEAAGKALLASFGIRVPACHLVQGEQDLRKVATVLSPPYVLKVVSPQVVHKSDFGAVVVGLQSTAEVARHMQRLGTELAAKGIRPEGWLIEEMIPAGLECVIGGVVDAEFGPMVMVGLGGIFVEIMGDVAFRICPIDRIDALDMLAELRGAALFRGARGRAPASLDAMADALVKVGGEGGVLMRCAAEVAEIDLNPLIVTGDAAIAVDARFILSSRG
jgi:acetyl-CoA synthetase (ADP-forming)